MIVLSSKYLTIFGGAGSFLGVSVTLFAKAQPARPGRPRL